MTHPSIVAINVGQPQSRGLPGATDPLDEPWTSGIFKSAVAGPVALSVGGFAGDGHADLVNHGGPDKAVCVYSADHYDLWRREFGMSVLPSGAFGENLTIQGLDEHTVCIGDVWMTGGATVQVSQPRQPCWKLARKWRLRDFVNQVIESERTGWYLRVQQEGPVVKGDAVVVIERPCPGWTIAAANAVMHHHTGDASALAALPALSLSWRHTLQKRLVAGQASSPHRGGQPL